MSDLNQVDSLCIVNHCIYTSIYQHGAIQQQQLQVNGLCQGDRPGEIRSGFDYPNARVFINFADGGSPGTRCKLISLVAPDGQSNVVTAHIELPGKVFGTHGYDCFIFSEGALEYGGKFGPGWISQLDSAQEGSGSRGNKRLEWVRKDGGTRKRTRTTIDAANWMKDLDGELYLSALTIPGSHDSHALVGTPLMPSSSPGEAAINMIANWYVKATKAAECQDWNIATQLQNGVRYFDFRYGDDLKMRHGQLELPGNLPECLQVVADFLKAHPQETVIVMAKWDKWALGSNDAFTEPDSIRTAADKAFTDLVCFLNVTSTPQLKNVRGKIIRKKEGGSTEGLDFGVVQRDSAYNKPAFNRPEYRLSRVYDAEQNSWAERSYAIDGVWAEAEHTLSWIRDVRPKAKANDVWDNTGLGWVRMDKWTIITQSTLFPVTIAKPTNQKLHRWIEANCSLAQRYELGVIQLDFAGSEGPALLTKLILTNFF